MKKIFLLLSMGLLLFSCGPQENPDPDTVIINQNGFTLEIPAGAFENDGEIFIGKTGDEPTSVPNPDLTVVGEPFTLKLPVDTLLAPITLSFPLPEESLTVNNGLFLLYNGTSYFPFEYEIIDGKVVVTIDTIDWEDISTKGKIAELLGFSLISDAIDDKVHIDERYLGIKEVSVVSGKVNYDDPASINSSSKILIFVHGLTGDPTGWEEYVKKIYQEPGRLSYTNIWTFGYHSDEDIDVRGGEFKRLLEQKINGRNPTIHIVAHSMGGLVSRSMLETHKGDNVGLADKLITLGTPHHGSPIEPIRHLIGLGVLLQGDIVNIIPYYKKMTQGTKDLNPESDFITRMRRSVNRNCSYFTIACKNQGFWAVLLRIPFFLSPNDGLVSVESAKGVQGAESPSFDATVPVPMAHFYMRTFSHEDPEVNAANEELYAQVKEFLQKNEQEVTTPSVTTGDVTNITTTTASCSGNVTSDGGSSVTARGVCWSTSQNPTTSNSKTTNGTGLGTYTSHITGLSPNTTYYVRAYATNSEGTAYGEQKTFTTNAQQATPSVTTGDITNITTTTASCSGNVTSDGGSSVTARGVCWSTSQNPTTSNSKTTNGTGLGTYTSHITGLSPNTTYYVRAYAINSQGTAYGEQRNFITQQEQGPVFGSFFDSRDGYQYETVTIGEQVWMAENLAYLPTVNPIAGEGSTTNPDYHVYNYDGTNVAEAKATNNYQTYGVLYNWTAALSACPPGWHLPSDEEWTILGTYLANNGYNYDGSIGGNKTAKSMASATGWNPSSNEGVPGNTDYPEYRNKSGFSALPGGIRLNNRVFNEIGNQAVWWTSTEDNLNNEFSLCQVLVYNNVSLNRGQTYWAHSHSVRCLRD